MTKEQRKVYEAAMRWHKASSLPFQTGYLKFCKAEESLSKACAAARKKEKK